ncbi:MAG: hypothetical protein M3135_05740 [Actinomycetota bacterium]|nr:hypothetical protein [Actinomycetota bacterium]
MGSRQPEEEASRKRRPLRSWVVKLAWLGVPLLLVGEAGHQLLGRLLLFLLIQLIQIILGAFSVAVLFLY